MRIFSFLDDSYDVIAVIKAKDHKSCLEKIKSLGLGENTPYFSEPIEECLYYTH
jgi:hypothetical protein